MGIYENASTDVLKEYARQFRIMKGAIGKNEALALVLPADYIVAECIGNEDVVGIKAAYIGPDDWHVFGLLRDKFTPQKKSL